MSLSKRFQRRRKRSGISNLIGAVFFIIIAALVISTVTAMFVESSGYIEDIHSSNQAALQAVNSNVKVSGVTFGGELTSMATTEVPMSPNTPLPLLPISNMNFSGSLQGWYVSESYPGLVDSATISNALQSTGSSYIAQTNLSSVQSSNPETFLLTITNKSPLGSGNDTAKITILVDTYFDSAAWGPTFCLTPVTCSGWFPFHTGNNLTMITGPPSDPDAAELVPGATATLEWTADVPQAAGTYHHTVVLYWHSAAHPVPLYSEYGIATVDTLILSPLPVPNPAAPTVSLAPRTPGTSPGGLIAGYDGNALTTTSSSGPGSVYVNFEPNFGGQRLPAGQQLSAGAAFTTTFSLSQADVCQLRVTFSSGPCSPQTCLSNCYMAASLSSSLDEVASVPNSLVYYHLLLVSPSGAVYAINQGGTDPTTLNHFGPTGWVQQNMRFPTSGNGSPPSGFWVAGVYKFELVVNATMPGGLPSELSMHFDDIGLALNLMTPAVGGSAYGSDVSTMTLPTGLTYNQVEELDLGLNMSLSSNPTQALSNTVAYIYVAETPVGILGGSTVTTWAEAESVIFNGSAAATTVIPSPQATSYVNGAEQVSVEVVAISVGGGLACPLVGPPSCTLTVSAYTVTQTEDTAQADGHAVIAITNEEGIAPVHLTSLFFSGPNGTLPANPSMGSTDGLASFAINDWVNVGGTILLYENLASQSFTWIPGQVYQVTVVSAEGVSYSASFTAP